MPSNPVDQHIGKEFCRNLHNRIQELAQVQTQTKVFDVKVDAIESGSRTVPEKHTIIHGQI